MKIFVTGATGFIGRKLVKRLVEKKYQVEILVRNKSDNKRFPKEVRIINGNLEKPDTFTKYLTNQTTLVHLAAIRSNWGAKENFIKTNSNSIKNFFKKKSKPKHMIITSSVYVFGKNNNLPLNENSARLATDIYGLSKINAEDITVSSAQKYKIPYTIIRPAIVYGPEDNKSGMILKMIRLVNSGKFPIIGSGNNTLQLIYIDDLIEGYIKAIEKGGKNQTYILAAKKPIILKKLIEIVRSELGVKNKFKTFPRFPLEIAAYLVEAIYKIGFNFFPKLFNSEPFISTIKIRTISDNFLYDISKAKRELDFNPRIDYKNGIRKTVKWFLNQLVEV